MSDSSGLTLMAVHAHPDDEASSTGGILARYAAEGVRTVLVTCTNGELGDAPDGTKPGSPGHNGAEVARHRRRELEASCAILGVSHLEMLGYHDSGMKGWPSNDATEAFWNTPVADGADRLGELMRRYRPDVVVTYDANGFYGHPDHIQAHRITLAALQATAAARKLYFPAIPQSDVARFLDLVRRAGIEMPPDEDFEPDFGTPDDEIAARVDCTAFAAKKYAALEAHASQGDNTFFLRFGLELFTEVFGVESFQRALDTTGSPVPEDDLFSGLRSIPASSGRPPS